MICMHIGLDLIAGRTAPMVTEADGQYSQIGEARTVDYVSGLSFVKVLMMEHLRTVCVEREIGTDINEKLAVT